MFDVLTNALALIFVLGVLVFIHEFGHFAVAKAFGVGVEVFSVGFGKRLAGFERGGTDYRVSVLPLGGYVKMVGENPDEELRGSDEEYLGKPKWQRFLILVAGPAMNVVLAFVLIVVVYLMGIRVLADANDPVILGLVSPGSPAEAAGLQVGDEIVSIDGDAVPNWEEARVRIMLSANQPMELGVERNGQTIAVPITPGPTGIQGTGQIGVLSVVPPEVGPVHPDGVAANAGLREGDLIVSVNGIDTPHYNLMAEQFLEALDTDATLVVQRDGTTFETVLPIRINNNQFDVGFDRVEAYFSEVRKFPLGEAIVEAGGWVQRQTAQLGDVLGRLFTGRLSVRTLSGPLEIARFSGGAARTGDPSVLLNFMAFISLQLGILNLLPIPVLDGGQIALIGIESVMRRDLSMQVKERITQVGLIMLVSLMAMVIVLDITKIIPDAVWNWLPF